MQRCCRLFRGAMYDCQQFNVYGVLAAIIDLGGLYAILTAKAVAVATVDLGVDYLSPFTGGRLRSTSNVVRLGSKVSTAETKITNAEGKLLASGRGVYLMGTRDT